MVKHTEDYERDGIRCTITVEEEDGALWGNWHCHECDNTGGSSKQCSTIEDAVLAAGTNAGTHIGTTHLR